MKKRVLAVALVLILALSITTSVLAQDYYFGLSNEIVNVYWNSDGTLSLDYQLTFVNQAGAHAIDFVDMGMPNDNFDMGTVTADVNGSSVSVSRSEYQGNGSGFAVVLGSQTIQPGETGTVHVFIGKISQVLYLDSDDKNYASAVFAPTYFGSQYVTGNTDLTVTFHLPPGVASEQPRWHTAPSGFPSEPVTAFDQENRVTYTWRNPYANASSQYEFGASFPKSVVPDSAIIQTNLLSLLVGLIMAVVGFIANFLPCLIFGGLFVGMPVWGAIQGQRRKMQYLPPKISIEGHGIKRGLTAVEAAILLEQPLDKVMTMILFGVLKKNAATVTRRDPLELQVVSPIPEELRDYETAFLKAFKEQAGRERQLKLQEMMVTLVRTVSNKMKGFSRRETIDYYKSITERAWQQVEAANTPEVKSQKYDEALEWTMLDKNYDDRTRRVFTGPIIVPTWWGRYDPGYRPASSLPKVGSAPSGSGRSSTALPGADFAAQMVIGVQTFSQQVVGNINTFTEKITNTTNPPPKPSSSVRSGGGGGGRSCACACACAGCACACAGGGR